VTEVLVAFVGAVGLVAAALANRGRQHAKAAREQVQNSHATNLRDDIDHVKRQNEDILAVLTDHSARIHRIEHRPRRRGLFQ
jgi:hypothetical protein